METANTDSLTRSRPAPVKLPWPRLRSTHWSARDSSAGSRRSPQETNRAETEKSHQRIDGQTSKSDRNPSSADRGLTSSEDRGQ